MLAPGSFTCRGGAEGTLRTEPAQVAKTNGVGQADLLWSQPFPVQANRNYILRLSYRTEDASLANLLLLRYTHSADDAPKLDTANDGFAMKCSSNGPACRKRPNSGGTSTAR